MATQPDSKCPYPVDFVERQAERLREEKAEVLENIDATEEDLLNWESGSDNDLTMSEGATAMTERELDMGLIENAKVILARVNRALDMVESGHYGWDPDAGVWIRQERLEALPWADREVPMVPRDNEPDRPPSL